MTDLPAAAAPEPPYLAGLNPPQREAVLTTEGPVLVLAGAGTGKTAALTARLAHLLYTRKAWPSELLAVTFTNKAAREMKERVGRIVGEAVEGMPWLGTFHSIGAKMLRRHAELVGLKSNFTILDTDDQLRLLKQLIARRRHRRETLAGADARRDDRPLEEQGLDPGPGRCRRGRGLCQRQGRQALRASTRRGCRRPQRLRFRRSAAPHAGDPEDATATCSSIYQQRFKYILVDEYQDTNQAQYLWLRLLAQERKNICCVGDDDQSIYSWRGAEVTNILRFEKDFPGAKIIRLEQNYRSTPQHPRRRLRA